MSPRVTFAVATLIAGGPLGGAFEAQLVPVPITRKHAASRKPYLERSQVSKTFRIYLRLAAFGAASYPEKSRCRTIGEQGPAADSSEPRRS
jgi:hypothetical protein